MSDKLTQERPRGNNCRLIVCEAVYIFIVGVKDDLKCMLCAKPTLEESQCIRQRLFALLHFDKKPWFAITHNNEIHLSP